MYTGTKYVMLLKEIHNIGALYVNLSIIINLDHEAYKYKTHWKVTF